MLKSHFAVKEISLEASYRNTLKKRPLLVGCRLQHSEILLFHIFQSVSEHAKGEWYKYCVHMLAVKFDHLFSV